MRGGIDVTILEEVREVVVVERLADGRVFVVLGTDGADEVVAAVRDMLLMLDGYTAARAVVIDVTSHSVREVKEVRLP